MNLHPIFVHFPIAILTIYAVMELLRFKKLQQLSGWWYGKAYLAIVGAVAAGAAFASGDEAGGRGITDPILRKVFELHETWAAITVTIFTIIAVHYLIELLRRNPAVVSWFSYSAGRAKVWILISRFNQFLGSWWLLVLLAFAGLIAITVTGGLGGSMVYGPDIDPVVTLIYKFLVN